LELITRRTKQLIVHSYLYYRLNESKIPDSTFDHWCDELVKLQAKYPEIAKKNPYWDIGQKFDESGSGFFITQYPTALMMDAEIFLHGFGGTKELKG